MKGDYFQFGSVFIKKKNQTKIFLKKTNQNLFKPIGFGSIRFGFLDKNRFGLVFLQFFWF